MHNVLSLSIFYRKTTKSKARIFRQGNRGINKKKIIKIEPVKRWKLDCKTKKQPEISDCRDMFTVVLLSMRF